MQHVRMGQIRGIFAEFIMRLLACRSVISRACSKTEHVSFKILGRCSKYG